MPRLITEKSFYQYIKCPSWVYFEAHAGESQPHDPLLQKLIDDGLIEEKQREILADRKQLYEVTAEDAEEAFLQTLQFMREGRQTIYRATLIDQHWVGQPDVLERVEGKSNLGDYYYVAADIKRTREVRDDHKFQGCFYAELLEKIQGVKPAQGYVITPERAVLSYLIEEFETEYKLTLGEIEAIVAGRKPPHFLTSGCKQSPWFDACRRESVHCDSLSVLNRIWREEVALLEDAGVKTIDELAALSVRDLARRVPGMHPPRLETLRDQAVAIHENHHIIRGRVDFPESAVEIFFDIESDPLRDFDYLFGVLAVQDGKGEYHSFFAEFPGDERRAWKEFVTFIEGHYDAPIYHYGQFEVEVVRRFIKKYGASAIAEEAFERNMIDLLYVMRPAIIFPLPFYSLKDIASYIGFAWRADDASGANSVLWFEEWMRTKNDALRKKILEYNEDDVRATHLVKKWVREHAS